MSYKNIAGINLCTLMSAGFAVFEAVYISVQTNLRDFLNADGRRVITRDEWLFLLLLQLMLML